MKKTLSTLLASLVLMLAPVAVFAVNCPVGDQPGALAGGAWFNCVISNFLNIVVWPVFITASIIMFIIAGFHFLTAQGEPEKINKARHAVLWAVIGIAVALIGYVAVGVIRGTLGLVG